MINTQDAVTILRHVSPLDIVRVPLSHALGHALAEDISADRDLPPADRSAMDGYAVRADDLVRAPCRLGLIGEVSAGSSHRPFVEPGCCVRIMTGGNIPPGADSVVILESTSEDGDAVFFKTTVPRGANIARCAEDAKAGEILIRRGVLLGALQLGLCASVGKAELQVFRRPRVAVVCTGEELRDLGESVLPHEIRNSNGPALCAALETWGYPTARHVIVRDSVSRLVEELLDLHEISDVILLTGGVSKGKYDFVRAAVEEVGARIQFHGVAMKPGKPLLYATMDSNKHIFGLPGNPLSAMTGFFEFVLPALRRLSGVEPDECLPSIHVPLASRITTKGGRTHFVMACLEWSKAGPSVRPMNSHSSADLVCGGRSSGVIVVPPDIRDIEAGAMVEFHSWKPLP